MALNATPQSDDFFDSLLRQAAEADSDTSKAKIYVKISALVNDPDTIIKYGKLAIDIAQRYDDKWTLMASYDNIGWAQYYNMKFNDAVESYTQSLRYATELGDKHFIGATSLSLGNVYYELSEISKMWDAYYRSLDIFTELKDTGNVCIVTRTIGQSFASVGMYKSAQEQYHKSLNLSIQMNDTVQMAYDYRNIGETYLQQFGESKSQMALQGIITAKKYLKIAERMMPDFDNDYVTAERIGNYISLADCYVKLAKMQGNRDYIDSCRHYLTLFKQNNLSETEGYLLASQTESDMLMLEGKHTQALPILSEALQYAIDEGSEHNVMSIYKRLSECYEHIGDKSKALDALKLHYDLKLKITNETEMRRASEYFAQQEIKLEKERIEQERILNEERRQRQKAINTALLVIITMMTVIVFLVYKAFRQKRRSNEVLMGKNAILAQQKEEIATQNDALREKSEEIASQRDLLASQKESLARTNRQMRDSITYAQRIQRTVITSQEEMDAIFPQNFVLYRPRDIVSGDFYRVDSIRGHKIIVVADCTGHGVPGALLSMMGISALKDILGQLEITGGDINPAAILQQLREFIKHSFNKNTTDDGMDMSICVLRPDGETMDFAGANQNAIIVHNGEITRIKGDFMPIGNYVKEGDFTPHQIKVTKGDMLYLFTDGIPDQLGGADFCKYSLRRLTDRLAALSSSDLNKQMYDIERDIELWMGDKAQLDDITLLGVRIN